MMRWSPTGTLSTLSLPPWPTPDWYRTLKGCFQKVPLLWAEIIVWGTVPANRPYGGPVSGLL